MVPCLSHPLNGRSSKKCPTPTSRLSPLLASTRCRIRTEHGSIQATIPPKAALPTVVPPSRRLPGAPTTPRHRSPKQEHQRVRQFRLRPTIPETPFKKPTTQPNMRLAPPPGMWAKHSIRIQNLKNRSRVALLQAGGVFQLSPPLSRLPPHGLSLSGALRTYRIPDISKAHECSACVAT